MAAPARLVPPRDPWHDAALLVGAAGLRAWGIEVRTRGVVHVPRSGPVVLAPTHVAYPDFVVLQKSVLPAGRRLRYLCRGEVWSSRVAGRALDRMRHVPVDRSAPAAAYLAARRLLEAGEAVGVFPEAGVSTAYVVRPLMRGAAALALETGAPLLPVGIWGTQRLWPVAPAEDGSPGRPDRTRGRVVDVRIDAPLVPRPDDDATSLTIRLGRRLAALLADLQALPHHQPRPGEDARWHPAHLGGRAHTRAEVSAWERVPRAAVPVAWGPPPETVGSPAGALGRPD
ncbi:lysophospholipid acyltransferase family protein [Nocardioides lentus]|uniref:Lysophospholipid acyltransferase family protein n=1 Tax=Nocardioides lentus TaxID=338077 RepID=A0ABN2PI58_9ACTN